MDFSRVQLSDDDRKFQDDVRAFLSEIVTEDVIRRDRETGDNFDEGVHLALGAAGYLEREWKPDSDRAFTRVQRRIWELEKRRAHVPWVTSGTTAMIARSVEKFASPELRAEVLPRVYSGHVRMCLGYTEPEGGSDVATCKTRAVRDGDGWVINGSKMFTSNAHHAHYVFLLTNTNPGAPKHQSLTMFLVPLDAAGVDVQPIRTVDGDRTNITFYSDVRIADRYRLGDVDGGWTVLRTALDAEHGTGERDDSGLQKIATMTEHALLLAEGLDVVAGSLAGSVVGEDSVAYRLGRSVARMEAALSTPGMYGRVAIATALRELSPELMDVQGASGGLASADLDAQYLFRLGVPMGIYGGTLEVFRNMIAQHALGLGRPAYAPAAGGRS